VAALFALLIEDGDVVLGLTPVISNEDHLLLLLRPVAMSSRGELWRPNGRVLRGTTSHQPSLLPVKQQGHGLA
jgi:hypothetical protein